MANYPAYQYQPPMYPQAYQQQVQQADQQLFCRVATNLEEVRAYPVDFSGRPMTFLGPGMQTIWVKAFNPTTGGSDVVEYRRAPAPLMESKEETFAPLSEVESLKQAVAKINEELARMRLTRRRATRDVEEVADEL